MEDRDVLESANSEHPNMIQRCRKCGALVSEYMGDRHVRWHRNLEILLGLWPPEDE